MRDEQIAPIDVHPLVAALAARIREEFPRFRLVAKERSEFMRALYRFGLMGVWNPAFMDGYTTTIGYAVYMPSRMRADGVGGVDVLRHERVHLEQFRRHPFWFPVSYLLLPPALVTMRARWELEAYVESMRAELDRTGGVSDETIDHIAARFTGPDYLFMDVRRNAVRRRLEEARRRLVA